MKKCACNGSFLERFIQPSVLLLLCKEDLHGFLVYKKLIENDIMNYSGIDPTGLYRTLKKMEEAGILASYLDTTYTAQPKRVYKITQDGKHCLKRWENTLRSYQESIGKLADAVLESTGE